MCPGCRRPQAKCVCKDRSRFRSGEAAEEQTSRYFRERAEQANEQAFLAVLDKIKQQAGPVASGDEL